jgi:CheY-like chemotaxis protein
MTTTHKTVLLIDDDVDFLEVNKTALEKAGFKVVVAHDSDEGFARAVEQPIGVAVLDVMMRTPDEGFQLARKLRGDARTKQIPLLMLTSVNAVHQAKGFPFHLSDADRDETWLPIDRFVDKPLAPTKLVALVKEIEA